MGGEPYGGRAIVFWKGRPVWIAVYYGRIADPAVPVQPIYTFLQQALLLAPVACPFRGPAEFADAAFTYRNTWRGDVEAFAGEEAVYQEGERVYTGSYAGGLVDR